MKGKTVNLEEGEELGRPLPTLEEELGSRLSAVINYFGSRQKASSVAQRSSDQLAKYVKGTAEPPFSAVARLAVAAGMSLDWVATGNLDSVQAPAQPRQSHDLNLDSDKLAEAIEAVDAALEALNSDLSPAARARVAVAVYRRQAESPRQLSPAELVSLTLRSIQEAVADESKGQGARS